MQSVSVREVALQKEIERLHKKIGQLTVENDFLLSRRFRLLDLTSKYGPHAPSY
jgi:hypothetical protein